MSRHVHINAIVKSGYYHLRNIAKIKNVLTLDTPKILIHAFVVSKSDSYNSLIFGLPNHLIDKLQHLLNAAARLIMVSRSSYSFAYARAVNISWYCRLTFAACDWF